jgi:hypothetical protein
MSRRSFALPLLVFAALAAGCGQTEEPDSTSPAQGSVAAVQVEVSPGSQPIEPAWVEWISPAGSEWRVELGDETVIFTGTSYIRTSQGEGTYVRTGSPEFLGYLTDMAVSERAVRSYLNGTAAQEGVEVATTSSGQTELRFKHNGRPAVARIERLLSPQDVQAEQLFAEPAQVRTRATEMSAAEPSSLPLRAYWFGPTVADRVAVTAVDHHTPLTPELLATPGWGPSDEAIVHMVFYEKPSAKGRSSALPGQMPPAGEFQVVSEPVDSEAARSDIEAFNGRNGDLEYPPWPRETVTLASGEEAVVIPDLGEGSGPVRAGFAVITPTTLVYVHGSVRLADIPALAAQLRPLG